MNSISYSTKISFVCRRKKRQKKKLTAEHSIASTEGSRANSEIEDSDISIHSDSDMSDGEKEIR